MYRKYRAPSDKKSSTCGAKAKAKAFRWVSQKGKKPRKSQKKTEQRAWMRKVTAKKA